MLKTKAAVVAKPTLQYKKENSVDEKTADCIAYMLSAAPSFHKLHLRVNGEASYSQHMALKDLYEGLPGLVDSIAEGYQGACEMILEYPEVVSVNLKSVEEAIDYLRELSSKIAELQIVMPHSEIVNDLDVIKSLINSTKYKLLFLK